MLNVELVQKHITKEFLKIVEKENLHDRLSYEESNLLRPWHLASLPNTCSGVEISMPFSLENAAEKIAQVLYSKYKYAQCSSVNRKVNEILELFGFKKVTSYMGNHRSRVHVYYINLENVKF